MKQCTKCGRRISAAGGTLFEHVKLPLATWFQAVCPTARGKKGVSAMDPVRKIGAPCNVAWRMKYKNMRAMMEREHEKPLAGLVQVDDVYLGGVREGKRGQGAKGEQGLQPRAVLLRRGCDLPSMVPRLAWAAARTPPVPAKLPLNGAGRRHEG